MDESAKIRKGHCPSCGPGRESDVQGEFSVVEYGDDEHGVWLDTTHRILQCRGCKTPYIEKQVTFSEDLDFHIHPVTGSEEQYIPSTISYWPPPSKRDAPSWINALHETDSDLYSLVSDVYTALNSDLSILAAIGTRTAFDKASELLGVDPKLTFSQKLDELVKLGKIGVDEKQTLSTLTDAGSAAAHRGWRPKAKELDTMVSLVEAFLYRTIVLEAEAKKLKATVPPKK